MIKKQDVLKLYKNRTAGLIALEKYKQLFPLKPSKQLARIVANLMCDGHLQGSPKWRLDFTSKYQKELSSFETDFFHVFRIKGKIRKCTGNNWGESYNYGVNCKPIARILYLCGVPFGAKVKKEFSIPEWISNDKEIFRDFAKRLFTCEGTIWLNRNPGIGVSMYKIEELWDNGKEFFEVIRKNLKNYFDIDTTNVFTSISKTKTKPAKIYIKRKTSILKFNEEIGFEDFKKQMKLNKLASEILKKGT